MSSPGSEGKGKAPLRSGFTTGACAAAAAKGAALMLREQRRIEAVELPLPAGFIHRFELHGQAWDERSARCFVVKDAGDDPDVTHGVEVHAEVSLSPPSTALEEGGGVTIAGGPGIGKVTKPGLAVPVGEWAINPVPRRMITEAVLEAFPAHSSRLTPHVVLSIPDGERRAARTLNARLGIVGGLSVLGTTGVVRPISHRAWTDTLDVALDVALASGERTVVLSSGRTSERAAQDHFGGQLREEAFVMMGDHAGYALRACRRKGVERAVLAVQFAKLVKIACGHAQTHVSSSRLDLGELARWGRGLGLDDIEAKRIEWANTARQVFQESPQRQLLAAETARRALQSCRRWAPEVETAVLLIDYDGGPAGRFGPWPAYSGGKREA